MKLIGNRIVIRDLHVSDLDAFYEYGKSEYVGPNAGWKPFPSITIASRILNSMILSNETYAVAAREGNHLIGTISLYHQTIRKNNRVLSMGFSLNHDYWNQGLMTEAVKLILDFAFSKTDCELLEVGHHVGNYGSKRVIEKCGFHFDGRLDKYKRLYDGRLIDADFYSLTKEEYERKKKYE